MPLNDEEFDSNAKVDPMSKVKSKHAPPYRKITESLGQNAEFNFKKFQKQNLRIGNQDLNDTEMEEIKNDDDGESDDKREIFLSDDDLSDNEERKNIE